MRMKLSVMMLIKIFILFRRASFLFISRELQEILGIES